MIPRRLTAPEPGWTLDTDIVVIGSGIAGLVAALRARTHGRVLLVTKALLDDGSTRWAQGGIAAALHPGDLVIMISYGVMDETEAKSYLPKVVHVDAANRIVELGGDPSAPVPGATDQRRSDLGVPVR